MTGMTISKAAQAAGVNVETIRFYERRGLIQQPPRPAHGGYRAYPADTVRRVRFIRRAQDLGFSLREIGELLSLRAAAGADAADVQRRTLEKLRDVDEKIQRLQQIRGALAELLEACPGSGTLQCCAIYEALEGDGMSSGNGEREGEAPMEKVKLTVENMHCAGCTEIVRHLLEHEAGVQGCVVSLEERQARVAVDPARTDAQRLAQVLEKAGYPARPAQ